MKEADGDDFWKHEGSWIPMALISTEMWGKVDRSRPSKCKCSDGISNISWNFESERYETITVLLAIGSFEFSPEFDNVDRSVHLVRVQVWNLSNNPRIWSKR